jgi:transcriptional regulator with XRE-family HTH domain
VSRVENGHTIPSIETLEKWAKALDVSMSQLFSDDGKTAQTLVLKSNNGNGIKKLNRVATNNLRRIESAFVKLSPCDQAIAVGLIQKFANR